MELRSAAASGTIPLPLRGRLLRRCLAGRRRVGVVAPLVCSRRAPAICWTPSRSSSTPTFSFATRAQVGSRASPCWRPFASMDGSSSIRHEKSHRSSGRTPSTFWRWPRRQIVACKVRTKRAGWTGWSRSTPTCVQRSSGHLRTRRLERGLRLAASLWRFWDARGHVREGRQWLEAFLGLADRAPDACSPATLAMAHSSTGILAWRLGDYECAEKHHTAALQLHQHLEGSTEDRQ